VYQDAEIQRPFFANVHVPGGVPVTRPHPPRAGIDAVDHATAAFWSTLPRWSFTTALACTRCPGASDESGAEIAMLVTRRPLRCSLAVRPSAERGSRVLEASQEMSRSAWSPKSTGAMVRYER